MLAILNRNDLQIVRIKVANKTPVTVINIHNTKFNQKEKLVTELNHFIDLLQTQNLLIGDDFNMQAPDIKDAK